MHPDLGLLADAAKASVLVGGKRLRPTFAYWGWRSVRAPDSGLDTDDTGFGADETALIRAASSLELLQACALVHDDVMDSSDTRRGQPAAHIRFAQLHETEDWHGGAATFGRAGAILLGDLLLSWAEEMFTEAIGYFAPDLLAEATAQFDLMRTEVVAGQFLDALAQARGAFDADEALRVIELKTSKYTVERPLLLGAGAAGAPPDVRSALSAYGLALGEAFQLRDDLLGVWGDPSRTGKPAGDDLREGKRTLLIALAAERADAGQRALLTAGVGDPALTDDGVAQLQDVLSATRARHRVEARIVDRAGQAVAALATVELQPLARQSLVELAEAAAHRSF